jgi:hypothetical protein
VKVNREWKILTEEWRNQDRELKEQHAMFVELEQRWRLLEQHIKKNKHKKSKLNEDSNSEYGVSNPQYTTTSTNEDNCLDEEIEVLLNEIGEIEWRENAELEYKKKILENIVLSKSKLSHNINMSELKLKEKEQEEKLSDLKAKELKRSVPHRQQFVKPLRRNQSQSDRTQSKGKIQANHSYASDYKGRNASATRIPTISARKKKGKKIRMNMSVDVDPKAHNNSSAEDEMPEEGNLNFLNQPISKELTINEFTKNELKPASFKGYTPTGIPPRNS